jgi:hypothetical protein
MIKLPTIFKAQTAFKLLSPAPSETLLAHPLTAIIPEASQLVVKEMAEDIRRHGLLSRILLYQGKILDGRARELGCRIANVEPQYEEYTGNNALDEVIARNALRKHLTRGQAALSAARLADLPVGANQFREGGWTIVQAARAFGINEKSVVRAKAILADGDQDLIAKVDAGELAISAAYNQMRARTPPPEPDLSLTPGSVIAEEHEPGSANPEPEPFNEPVVTDAAVHSDNDGLTGQAATFDGLSNVERRQLLALREIVCTNTALRELITTVPDRLVLRLIASIRAEAGQTA